MTKRSNPVPKKLKQDAIIEAILEIRFDMKTLPEVFIGRLADCIHWKGFTQNRMPAYDVPAPLRQADPHLRYQPVFELVETGGNRSVRIGPQVISYHRLSPYIGWERFSCEINEAIEALFEKTDGLQIRRLGLRYINALRADVHGIRSISDLDLELKIASERLSDNVNVNFITSLSDDTKCTIRVATNDFAQGVLPQSTSVLVDVDVFTKDNFKTKDIKKVKEWVDFAHIEEKKEFFRLLTDDTINTLKE